MLNNIDGKLVTTSISEDTEENILKYQSFIKRDKKVETGDHRILANRKVFLQDSLKWLV